MNTEALNSALSTKRDFSNTGIINTNSSSENSVTESSTNNFLWLYEAANLTSVETDQTSTVEDNKLFLSNDGWKSGNYSFIPNADTINNNNKYSGLQSFSVDTDSTYSAAKEKLISSLKTQLSEAKTTLSNLETEKSESKKKAKKQLMSYIMAGGKVDETTLSFFSGNTNSYDSKIRMQQITISNLESRLEKLDNEQ